MSAAGDLLAGLAVELSAVSAGVYDPARVWTATDTDVCITIGAVPQVPDRVIVLKTYRLGGDDPAHPAGTVNVQAVCRGRPNDLDDTQAIDGIVYDTLQGLTDRTYGAVHVVQVMDKSAILNGRDANNRWELSTNYTAQLDLPATANRAY